MIRTVPSCKYCSTAEQVRTDPCTRKHACTFNAPRPSDMHPTMFQKAAFSRRMENHSLQMLQSSQEEARLSAEQTLLGASFVAPFSFLFSSFAACSLQQGDWLVAPCANAGSGNGWRVAESSYEMRITILLAEPALPKKVLTLCCMYIFGTRPIPNLICIGSTTHPSNPPWNTATRYGNCFMHTQCLGCCLSRDDKSEFEDGRQCCVWQPWILFWPALAAVNGQADRAAGERPFGHGAGGCGCGWGYRYTASAVHEGVSIYGPNSKLHLRVLGGHPMAHAFLRLLYTKYTTQYIHMPDGSPRYLPGYLPAYQPT